jgi:hypothetical protein
MTVEAIDTTTKYPISPVTAEALQRPLFGHVIDGRVVGGGGGGGGEGGGVG